MSPVTVLDLCVYEHDKRYDAAEGVCFNEMYFVM